MKILLNVFKVLGVIDRLYWNSLQYSVWTASLWFSMNMNIITTSSSFSALDMEKTNKIMHINSNRTCNFGNCHVFCCVAEFSVFIMLHMTENQLWSGWEHFEPPHHSILIICQFLIIASLLSSHVCKQNTGIANNVGFDDQFAEVTEQKGKATKRTATRRVWINLLTAAPSCETVWPSRKWPNESK